MKKTVIIGIVLILVAAALWYIKYSDTAVSGTLIPGYSDEYIDSLVQFPENPDNTTYVPWGDGQYSYKSYTGEPSIDSPEFEAVNKERRAAGGCSLMPYSKYHLMPQEEAEALAKTDSNAMLELHFRKIAADNITITPELMNAAEMGNVQAKLLILASMDEEIYSNRYKQLLERYETITPQATMHNALVAVRGATKLVDHKDRLPRSPLFNRLVYARQEKRQEDLNNTIKKLMTATNYPDAQYFAAMCLLAITPMKDYPNLDLKDLWCEAYFNGCPTGRYHSSCQNP